MAIWICLHQLCHSPASCQQMKYRHYTTYKVREGLVFFKYNYKLLKIKKQLIHENSVTLYFDSPL